MPLSTAQQTITAQHNLLLACQSLTLCATQLSTCEWNIRILGSIKCSVNILYLLRLILYEYLQHLHNYRNVIMVSGSLRIFSAEEEIHIY